MLHAAELADRAQSPAADLAHALRHIVGRRKDLVCPLVEQKVIVAKVTTQYVPVKVLRLQVPRHTGK
jgi:hypothetical protein